MIRKKNITEVIRTSKAVMLIYLPGVTVYMISIFALQFSIECRENNIFLNIPKEAILYQPIIDTSSFFFFLGALLFLYIICLSGFIYSVYVIYTSLPKIQIYTSLSLASIVSILNIILIIIVPSYFDLCVVYVYFYFPFDFIANQYDLETTHYHLINTASITWLFILAAIITNLAWFFVVLTNSIIIIPLKTGPRELVVSEIAMRLITTRYTLYFAGAVLISNTVHISIWLQWPATLISDETYTRQVLKLGDSFAFYYGTTMTLVLGSVFLPVISYLRRKARTLADPEIPVWEQNKWLEQHGLLLDLRSRAREISAVLAPMVASSLSALPSIFSS